MDEHRERGLLIVGGACAILWPLLTLGYYVAYPIAAGGAISPHEAGFAGFIQRVAQLSQRPAVAALEWTYVALPLLLWPFLVALWHLLRSQKQSALSTLAVGFGLLGLGAMTLSYLFNPTALHALARAYADAGNGAEGAAIQATAYALLGWMRGLNQVSSLLYQACVALFGLALIRSRTWRVRGWLGLVGAMLALPAKLSLGLNVPTNALWTGLAYGVWPVAVGIGLLRTGMRSIDLRDPEKPVPADS